MPSSRVRWFLAVIAALLLLPQIFSRPDHPLRIRTVNFGWPRVYSGDEPHYLILLYSLLDDGDLDQRNNYLAAHQGGPQAGKLLAGHPLEHHASWYQDGEIRRWVYYYEFRQSATGEPVPVPRPGVKEDDLPEHEYSIHPPGLPMYAAAFVWPLQGTNLLEPAVLILAGLTVVVTMFVFYWLLGAFAESERARLAVTAVTFLGTPIWHYGRTFYCEPHLLFFTVTAYALTIRRREIWAALLAGVLLGIGVLMKAAFGVVVVPVAVYLLIYRGWLRAFAFCLPVACFSAAVLWLSWFMFGSPFRPPQEWFFAEWTAPLQLWVSLKHGILPFLPIALVALTLWPWFWRQHKREASLLAAGFLMQLALISVWGGWDGAFCYGPRLMVPVLPLLLVPLVLVPQTAWFEQPTARRAMWTLAGLSILANAIGALPYWNSWNAHPLLVGLEVLIRTMT